MMITFAKARKLILKGESWDKMQLSSTNIINMKKAEQGHY